MEDLIVFVVGVALLLWGLTGVPEFLAILRKGRS
jgi:hypothetical protein